MKTRCNALKKVHRTLLLGEARMNGQAVERLMFQTGRAEEMLKIINQCVDNHVNVQPEEAMIVAGFLLL